MRTTNISVLKKNGFLIENTHPREAVDCTKISSNEPFWFYNKNFDFNGLDCVKSATHDAQSNTYKLYIAGLYASKDRLPFMILSKSAMEELVRRNATIQSYREEQKRLDVHLQNALYYFEDWARTETQII